MQKKKQMANQEMAPWMKWGALLLAVVLLVSVVLFALSQKGALAVVNGQKVTVAETIEQLGQFSLYDDTVQKDNVYYQDHIAPYVAYDLLLMQEAAKREIKIEDSKVTEDAANTLKYLENYFLYEAANKKELEVDTNLLFNPDEAVALPEKTRLETELSVTGSSLMAERLKVAGLTREYFTKVSRNALTIDALKKKMKEELNFTEEEILAYYTENLADKYIEKNTSHILVGLEDEALANEIYAKLMAGADWLEMSDLYNTDEVSKLSGGNIGYYSRTGGLVKEYIDGAFALTEDGQISQPVKSSFGYHIIRLESTRQKQLEAVSDDIRESLRNGKLNTELAKLVEAAKITPDKVKNSMLAIAKGQQTP